MSYPKYRAINATYPTSNASSRHTLIFTNPSRTIRFFTMTTPHTWESTSHKLYLTLALLSLSVLLTNCRPASTKPDNINLSAEVTIGTESTQEAKTNTLETKQMKPEHIAWINSALDSGQTGITLEPAEPLVPAEQVGATASLGYYTSDPELWISIYQFDHGDQHRAAYTELQKHLPSEELVTSAGGSGPLFIIGYATPTGDELTDKYHPLFDLLSRLAGEE